MYSNINNASLFISFIKSKLTWGPYLAYKTSSIVRACDYVGESLASFLGITTAKYQFEIDQFKKTQVEAANAEKLDMEARSGWVPPDNSNKEAAVTSQDQVQKF